MKLKKGDILPVFKSFWAIVRNKPGIASCNNIFYYGGPALICGNIKVEKVDYKKDRVLFVVCGANNVTGRFAPTGTSFVETISEFVTRYEEDKKKRKAQVKEDKEIQKWIEER
jgi:hypothetical protein